jgi:hypothetical protein
VLLFNQKPDRARDYLDEAEVYCRRGKLDPVDLRELGRILLCQAQVCIAQSQLPEALKRLEDAERHNEDGGDERRSATSRALRGIALWRLGDLNWRKPLEMAIEQHASMGDWRNAVTDALSLGFMTGYGSEQAALEGLYPNEKWASVIRQARESGRLKLFSDYWNFHFRPTLLQGGPAVERTHA